MQNYGLMKKIFSNRLYPLPPEKSLDLLIYSQLPDKRWDSSDLTYLLEKYFSPIIAVKRFKVAFPWLADNLVFGHYLVKEIGRLHSMDDIRLKIEQTFTDGIT